jgi:hypothetical protein
MRSLRLLLLVLVAAAAAGLLYASRSQPPPARPADGPSRSDLFRRLFDERNLLIVYGTTDAASAQAYSAQVATLPLGRRMQVLDIQPDTAVTWGDLRGRAVWLIGTAGSNRLLAALSQQLPFSLQPDHLTFQEATYAGPSDVISLLYPNPADPRYPLFVLAGNRDAAVLRHLQVYPRAYDYQLFREGRRIRYGLFAHAEDGSWAFAPAQDHDLTRDTRLAFENDRLRLFAHGAALDDAALRRLARQREARLGELGAFMGIAPSTLPRIDYYVYPTLEAKALATDDMLPAHVDTVYGTVHIALEAGLGGSDQVPEAALLARQHLGRPARTVLEAGLQAYFSTAWHTRDYAYWAARLFEAGYALPLSQLLDDTYLPDASPLMVAPLAGALAEVLIETWGRGGFLTRYAAWQPDAAEVAALAQRWHSRLRAYAVEYRAQVAHDRAAFPAPPSFQKGFNFAHEGYAIDDGYASRRADSALARLASLGSNAVTLLPYSFMPSPQAPAPLSFASTARDENDQALIHAAMTAHGLGLAVMLKPQLWLRGAWPGAIEMASASDWDRFFDHYERWISHYALLAEMHGMELLCMGVELRHVTLGHPERWAALAGRLRKLYSGRLVYAANWGDEAEQMGAWDAFDYIGVSHYYPLSQDDAPTDAALLRGAEASLRKLEVLHHRFDKPVLLAEVGFPSIPAPWKQPHEEDRAASPDPEAQARAYRAILSAVEDKSWIHGLYWWKWPSDGQGGTGHRGFTPYGKPAEGVVAHWFRAHP